MEFQEALQSEVSKYGYGPFYRSTFQLPNPSEFDQIIENITNQDARAYSWQQSGPGQEFEQLRDMMNLAGEAVTPEQRAQLTALSPTPQQRPLSSDDNERLKRCLANKNSSQQLLDRCTASTAKLWEFFDSNINGEVANFFASLKKDGTEARHLIINQMIDRIMGSKYLATHREVSTKLKLVLKKYMPNSEGHVTPTIETYQALEDYLTLEESVFRKISEHAQATEAEKHPPGHASAGTPVISAIPVADTDATRIAMLYDSMMQTLPVIEAYNEIKTAHQKGNVDYPTLLTTLRDLCKTNKVTSDKDRGKHGVGAGSAGHHESIMMTHQQQHGHGYRDGSGGASRGSYSASASASSYPDSNNDGYGGSIGYSRDGRDGRDGGNAGQYREDNWRGDGGFNDGGNRNDYYSASAGYHQGSGGGGAGGRGGQYSGAGGQYGGRGGQYHGDGGQYGGRGGQYRGGGGRGGQSSMSPQELNAHRSTQPCWNGDNCFNKHVCPYSHPSDIQHQRSRSPSQDSSNKKAKTSGGTPVPGQRPSKN